MAPTVTETKFNDLKARLRELFELDKSDLDFGIYRIMAAKNREVNEFLDRQLKAAVRDTLAAHGTGAAAEIENQIQQAQKAAHAAGFNPDESPTVKELKARLASGGAASASELEADIYNHLLAFFSRYYDEGDFISKRRYKGDVYAIPYNGQEVTLHWANKDQYYIKSGEWHKDYRFKAGGKTVHFKLVEATQEANNNKEPDDAKRRFILAADQPVEANDSELTLRFEFRVPTEAEKQAVPDCTRIFGGKYAAASRTKGDEREQFCADAEQRALAAMPETWKGIASAPAATDAKPARTVLGRHLEDFTARNTFDYFIHKDLGGFLKRELDFYIKNEVVRLDDLEALPADHLARLQGKVKAIRTVAARIIDFLASIENFQKKIWLKKKFVLETNYCFTLDRIPRRLYPDIVANDAQREEWVKLFAIDEIRAEKLGDVAYSRPLTVEFLKSQPHLVLDTKHFSMKFKEKLLESMQRITLDRIPEDLYPEIAANDAQRAEWVKRFAIDEITGAKPGEVAHSKPLTVEFLKAQPQLELEPRHFAEASKKKLLAATYGHELEESFGGVLVHSENFQALHLLSRRYSGHVDCIYIDPPYNTGDSEILYKNEYMMSSWLTFIENRLRLAAHFIATDAVLFIAIDDFEMVDLCELLDVNFPNLKREMIVVNHHPQGGKANTIASTHEYMLACVRKTSDWSLSGRVSRDGVELRPFRRSGTAESNFRYKRPNSFYAILVDPSDRRVVGLEPPPARDTQNYPTGATREGLIRIYPLGGQGEERVWRRSYEKCGPLIGRHELQCTDNLTIYHAINARDRKAALFSNWTGTRYNAGTFGANLLNDIIGKYNPFSYPKSIHTVSDAIFSARMEEDSYCMDFFGGSGTTAHAIINLNREDDGNRKYILAEMGEHFNTVLLPRIKKVVYSKDWKDGKPTARDTGISHAFKYLRLESYEDALNNLPAPTGELLAHADPATKDALITYSLDLEMGPSLLNLEAFRDPWGYSINAQPGGAAEIKPHRVDLVETFNYLLGLKIKAYGPLEQYSADFVHAEHDDNLGRLKVKGRLKRDAAGPFVFQRVEGELLDGTRVLIIWRKLTAHAQQDAAALEAWMLRHREQTKERSDYREYHQIYINGPVTLPQPTAEIRTVMPIEQTFKDRMFANGEGD